MVGELGNYVWRGGYREYDGRASYTLLEVVDDGLVETEWKCVVQTHTEERDWAVLKPDGEYLRNGGNGVRMCGKLHQMMRTAIDQKERQDEKAR